MSTNYSTVRGDPRVAPKRGRSRDHSSAGAGYGDTEILALASQPEKIERPALGSPDPIPCPCCSQPVSVPALEMIIHHYNLKPIEARILRAVWRGKGLPVRAQKIYDEMYADDPDGGPSASNAYASFKSALCYLRGRLKGSGVSIETVGYRKGYRLILGEH